ncbi:hypothetical protein [Nocardioides potassii]|nr:hypothetical protein [Nocardioides potassii]
MNPRLAAALYALGCLFCPRLCDFIDQAVLGHSPLNLEETP